MTRVVVFGDSHSVIFTGQPYQPGMTPENISSRFEGVDVNWMPDALAWHLMPDGSIGKHGEGILNRAPPNAAAFFLCFGEIDVRNQILRRAARGASISDQINKISASIVNFSKKLHQTFNTPVFVCTPVGSQKDMAGFNILMPSFGDEVDRNAVTLALEESITSMAYGVPGIHIIPLAKFTIDGSFRTISKYYVDGCHLNLDGLDLISRLSSLSCADYEIDFLDLFKSRVRRRMLPQLIDTVPRARIYLLNFSNDGLRYIEFPTSDFAFYPTVVTNPEVLIDIGFVTQIHRIIFRTEDPDGFGSVTITGGLRPSNLHPLWTSNGRIFRNEAREVDLAGIDHEVRFIRLAATGMGRMSLPELKVLTTAFSQSY